MTVNVNLSGLPAIVIRSGDVVADDGKASCRPAAHSLSAR